MDKKLRPWLLLALPAAAAGVLGGLGLNELRAVMTVDWSAQPTWGLCMGTALAALLVTAD